jgi:hypothetical protein
MHKMKGMSIGFLVNGFLCACNGTTEAARSEDRWLDVCRKDADCASGMICECGVCSKHCSKDLDCMMLSASAVCATSIPATSLCDDRKKLEPLCVIECTSNSSCGALGERGVCSSEWCRRASADSVVDGGLLDCADQRELIRDALQPLIDRADRTCNSDSDCQRVTLSNACFGDGCSGEYASRAAAEQLSDMLAALEDEHCPKAFEAGCTGPSRVSCPLQHTPKCVASSCQ